ncbi:ATP-binding protein [Pannonibacter sp. Pt2]|uniref:histidine kinase n=1 Tax=Pannonibacter anstelovis TaxID=3121537 RepID=A0ABU7ZSM6_9HYPH
MLDSLLKQNVAVLVATILGALLVSLVLITGLVLHPQIERSASDTAQTIRNLELSFAQMDPFQQILFAEALRGDEAPGVLVAETAPQHTNAPRSWFTHYFLQVLTGRHGIAPSDVMVDTEGRVWTRIATADQPYWLSLRTIPASDPVTGALIAFGIALIAALAGGIALQRRIALPLKRLEDAVGRMSNPFDAYDSDIARPREVAAVSHALTDMSKRLQAAEADRALMLAGVSHDLRTPLTKLRLTLAMLKEADPALVAAAERNVIRIEGMLCQFLDFARGFETEETRAVPLRPLLQQAIESCADPVAVVLDAPTDAVIRAKEMALLRALDNLLTNAFRYGKPPITVCGRIQGEHLLIDVRDSGHGLSPVEARDLMRPFARGNAARAGEGTGLGLAIVHQIAKAHEGGVEFEQNEGSFTVRIRIPQAAVA